MNELRGAIRELHRMDELAAREGPLSRVHPLAKLLITLLYLALVMSFGRYALSGLCAMSLYLIVSFTLAELSFWEALRRLRLLLLGVLLLGAANPLLDRSLALAVGGLGVTGGVLSMLTLLLKAGFAVFASYLLIATTTMEELCHALRLLHVPRTLVSVVMLIYRYSILLLREAERTTLAYSLRAPDERGIHPRAWGTLAGLLLLRSIDRAGTVYQSMALRGFAGEFYPPRGRADARATAIYAAFWGAALLILRVVPVFEIVGGLL